MELSLEEVLRAVEMTGFKLRSLNEAENGKKNGEMDLVAEKTNRVDCEYTADKEAMMKWIYETRFWIATKS